MITSLLTTNRAEIVRQINRTNFLCAFVSLCETFHVLACGKGGNFLTRRHKDTKKRDLRV